MKVTLPWSYIQEQTHPAKAFQDLTVGELVTIFGMADAWCTETVLTITDTEDGFITLTLVNK